MDIRDNSGAASTGIAMMTGTIGLFTGLVMGFTSGPEKPDIGIKFKNLAEANLRRDFGLLPKDQLDQAVSKAVEQYMATGTTNPVIVDLPPRPAPTPAL